MLVNLIIGIVGSLISATLVFLFASWFSQTTRIALTAIASTFLSIEIKYVFKDGDAAQKTIHESLKRSSTVRILAGRGNEFQGVFYSPLLEINPKIKKKIQILLPDVINSPRGVDWIAYRENELSQVDNAFGKDLLKQQIKTVYHFLSYYHNEGTIELKGYDAPHIGKIIITDDYVFLTPYSATSHGRQSRITQYGRGDIYEYYVRYFEMVWEDSKEVFNEQQNA